MIDKNANVIKDPKIKRIVEYSADNKQINVLDKRFYRRNDKYYPSVSSILNYFPKNQFFHAWLKDVGHNSDIIARKAADEGTQVHEMCEDYLNGKELNFLQNGIPMYDTLVWQMFLRFVDWWETYNPTLIETEVHLFSDEIEVAGTCDMVCEIDGELWINDKEEAEIEEKSAEKELPKFTDEEIAELEKERKIKREIKSDLKV